MQTSIFRSTLALTAAASLAGVASAWTGNTITVDEKAARIDRSWSDLRDAITGSIAKTWNGYYAESKAVNSLGEVSVGTTLSEDEVDTYLAMSMALSSPIVIRGPVPQRLRDLFADFFFRNAQTDFVVRQGHVVVERDGVIVVRKHLWGMNGGTSIVAFCNPTDAKASVTVCSRELEYNGKVSWTDRMVPDSGRKGEFANEFKVELAPHASRLFYMAGTAAFRNVYRAECAKNGDYRCIYVPADGEYDFVVAVRDFKAKYTVNVNGKTVGTFRGPSTFSAKCFTPENRVLVTGDGVKDVQAVEIYRQDSLIDQATRAAREGRGRLHDGADHDDADRGGHPAGDDAQACR